MVGNALILRNSSLLPAAISILQNAIACKPKSLWAYNVRGLCHVDLQQFKDGIIDFKHCLTLDSDYKVARENVAWANIEWGLVLDKQNKFRDAYNCLNEAVEFRPEYHVCYNNRGYYASKLGKRDAAIRDYKKCLSIDPNYTLARTNLNNLLNK
jgi:tetratricopeptide (TPR) repeat protein